MKNLKTLLSIIVLLSLTTSHAQWQDQFRTDDFVIQPMKNFVL